MKLCKQCGKGKDDPVHQPGPSPNHPYQKPQGFWSKFGDGVFELIANVLYQGPR